MATINVSVGQSIQAAIDSATDGDTIVIAAGTFDEAINVNKSLVIRGANAGIDGVDGGRGAETILTQQATLSGTGNVILNGLMFLLDDPFPASPTPADTYTAVLVSGTSGDHQIKHSVFDASPSPGSTTPSSFLSLSSAPNYRGVEIASVTGSVQVFDNLFTGDNTYPYAGDVWRSAIYSNGGTGTTDITNNRFENTRTAINADNFDENVSIDGNTFANSGSGISIGVTISDPVTNITNNIFDDVDTDFNLRNLATGADFDIGGTGNSATDSMLILGTTGDDDVTGTDGNDIFVSNGGEDSFDGGDGDDIMIATPMGGEGVFTGGAGEDRLIVPVTGNFNTVIIAPDEAFSSFGVSIDDDQLLIYSSTGATQVVDASDVEFIEISKDPAVGGSDITGAGLSFFGDISATGFDVNNILFASSTGNAPVAVDDAVTTDEDTLAFVNVLANDIDVDGDNISILQLGVPGMGSANHAGGVVTYDPGLDFQYLNQGETTTQTITYMITDDNSGFSLADIVFTITGVNDAPVVLDDTAITDEDTPIGINVLFNDDDVDVLDDLTIQSIITTGTGFNTVGSVSFDANGLITYDPNGQFETLSTGDVATDRVDYVAVDEYGATETGTLIITIAGVNDDPVAMDDSGASFTVSAADILISPVTLPGNVLANDTDVETTIATPLTVTGSTPVGPTIEDVSINPDGEVVVSNLITLGLLALGAGETVESFYRYSIMDSDGGTDTAIMTLTITGSNDAPITNADSGLINEDAGLVGFDVLVNDTDVDTNDTLSLGFVSRVSGVGGILGTDGDQITFDTNGDFDYLDDGDLEIITVSYVATDGIAGTISGLTIAVSGVNDAPDAVDDAYTVNEDSAITRDVTLNDSDAEDGTVNFLGFAGTASLAGLFTDLGLGEFTYDTDGQFEYLGVGETATESFTYAVSDDAGLITSATVTLTINGQNDAPIASDDNAGTTDEDTPFTSVSVLQNDNDPDASDTIFVSDFDTVSALGGLVTYNGDGTFDYDPNGQFENLAPGDFASDIFFYTISDGSGATDTGLVELTITGVNDAPIAGDDTEGINEDLFSITFDALSNDSDIDDGQTISFVSFTDNTTRGVLSHLGSGVFEFQTNGEFEDLGVGETEQQTFTYTIEDDEGATDTATVTITIFGANDDPVVTFDTITVDEDNDGTFDVLANDFDPDTNDTLTIANVVTSTANFVTIGNVTTDGSTVTYDPNDLWHYLAVGETATDRFNYRVIDGNGGSTQSRVDVTITGVNDGPVANDDALVGLNEDASTLLLAVLANDTDVDNGAVLSVASVDATSAQGAALSIQSLINPNDRINYDAAGLFNYLAVGETATDSFSYVVTDEHGATDVGTVTFQFVGSNDDPEAENDTATTDEDTLVNIDVLANDFDPDTSDTFSIFTVITDPVNNAFDTIGTATLNGSTIDYDPNGMFDYLAVGETATDRFNYSVEDNNGARDGARVDVTITGVNDGPTANDDTGATDEDTIVSIELTANDTDPDNGAVLSVAAVDATSANGASVSIDTDSNVFYDPTTAFNYLAAGETATDTFSYTVTDEHGATDTATVVVTITGVNDEPVVRPDTATTDEDTSVFIDVLANDSDPDTSDVLEVFNVVTSSTLFSTIGLVTFDALGVTYDPNGQFESLAVGETATDSFGVRVIDGNGSNKGARVDVTITGVNDGPVANADTAATDEDTAIDVDVLGNDTDVDNGAVLSVAAVDATSASGVALSVNGDGTIAYDPSTVFNSLAVGDTATDTFSYTVTDEHGATATATATITITGVNDSPVAGADARTVGEDALTIMSDLLLNDTDPDGDSLEIVGLVTSNANFTTVGTVSFTAGTVTYDTAGQFEYLALGETASDVFRYRIGDGNGGFTTGRVVMTIEGANDAPTANDDTAMGFADAAFNTGDVLANDTDPDASDVLTVISFDAVSANGALISYNNDGTFSYDPNGQFSGLLGGQSATDTFSYTIWDSAEASDTATVTVTVKGPNTVPVANDDTGATDEDTATTIDLLGNDVDPDIGAVLTVTAIDDTGLIGSVTDNGDGTVDYDPTGALDYLNAGETITETFSYTVTDDQGATDTATVTVTVTGVNDEPVAVRDNATTDEDTAVNIDVLANDSDPDAGDTFFIQNVITGNANFTTIGTATINGDTIDYDPNGMFDYLAVGETATDRFNYRIEDSNGARDTARVDIIITGVNDGPTANDDTGAAGEDGPAITIDLIANDTDPDLSDVLSIASIDTAGLTGVVTDNGDGTIDYDPTGNWDFLAEGVTATETFTYVVTDGNGGSDTASVTVTITGINDDPIARRDSATTDEDTPTNIAVLANDTDVDLGDTLTITDIITSNANFTTIGVVTLNGDTIDYDPNGQFDYLSVGETATDRFNYWVEDDFGGRDPARVDVTIIGVNDIPVANDDTGMTTEDGPSILIDLLANDTDVDLNDVLSVASIDDSGLIGSVTDNADGTVTYDPGAGFQYLAVGNTATETFSYTVTVGNGGSDTATVTITSEGVNDAPELINFAMHACVRPNDDLVLTSGELLATDIDQGTTADDLVYTLTAIPALGEILLNGVALAVGDTFTQADIDNGLVSISNDDGEPGDPDMFSFTVEDDQGATIGPFDFNFEIGPPMGTPNDDVLHGCPTDDIIRGLEGQDYIEGKGGSDTLSGNDGDDIIHGDTPDPTGVIELPPVGPFVWGDDFITGGQGQDQLFGNSGDDEIRGGTGDDRIWGDFTFFTDEDGNDELSGGQNNDHIFGGGGDDIIRGQAGDDWLYGDLDGVGPDAREGEDRLFGGADQDRLFGGGGDDRLNGGNGNDYLYGGAGADRMTGGSGKDDFYLSVGEADGDRITDFEHLVDRIILEGFGTGATLASAGGDMFTVTYNGGADTETFTVDGYSMLDNQDFLFQ
ncbi:MAG: hypothetical protein Alpg2KO_10620 [Alphaproteobacteria bacterium]